MPGQPYGLERCSGGIPQEKVIDLCPLSSPLLPSPPLAFPRLPREVCNIYSKSMGGSQRLWIYLHCGAGGWLALSVHPSLSLDVTANCTEFLGCTTATEPAPMKTDMLPVGAKTDWLEAAKELGC